jgi:protein-ribulosamine 3-kinase
MTDAVDFAALGVAMSTAVGVSCAASPVARVSGGCINDCYRWPSEHGAWFVKVAPIERFDMLDAEAAGLRELAAANAVRVPAVIGIGRAGSQAFLALEWLERGASTARAGARLGERLAAQHRTTAGEFGWHRDNTIGLTPQHNARAADWTKFYIEHRLRFQLALAKRNGFSALLAAPGERLLEATPVLLAGHRPRASLLHGDLWGGNWFTSAQGEPVIFDPAVYYGDREADLAMTHLFGGFDAEFYAAYRDAWPLEPGDEVRRDLYNLYHVLNHANLFGEGYARQAAATMRRLLAQARG